MAITCGSMFLAYFLLLLFSFKKKKKKEKRRKIVSLITLVKMSRLCWLIHLSDKSPSFFLMFLQFSGINGVLYYTPQILQQAGVSVLLSNLGIGSESASFLISAFTNFLMLPCIAVGMRFMDLSGRR